MSYEVYIDVFFAVNALLNLPVLILVKRIQHYKSSKVRIVLASMAGSGFLSILLCLTVRKYVPVRIAGYAAAYGAMGAIAFPDRRGAERIRTAAAIYIAGLLFNGVFRWLSMRIEHMPGLLGGCLMVYVAVCGSLTVYKRLQGKEHEIYEVRLRYHGTDISMRGLWDTGNRLRSPYHGRGISVVNYDSISGCMTERLRQFVEKDEMSEEPPEGEHVYYVPYETVSHKHGMMPVIEAEQLCIMKDSGMLEYQRPLLGISRLPVSGRQTFQIILTTEG